MYLQHILCTSKKRGGGIIRIYYWYNDTFVFLSKSCLLVPLNFLFEWLHKKRYRYIFSIFEKCQFPTMHVNVFATYKSATQTKPWNSLTVHRVERFLCLNISETAWIPVNRCVQSNYTATDLLFKPLKVSTLHNFSTNFRISY